MSTGRRRGSRTSRQPGRKPETPKITQRHSPSTPPRPQDSKSLIVPGTEAFVATNILGQTDLAALPAHVMALAVFDAIFDRPNYNDFVVAAQVSLAFKYLGFTSEVITSCATVIEQGKLSSPPDEIGVWQKPPLIDSAGTTDGHFVVWVDELSRLIDPTIGQYSDIFTKSRGQQYRHPAILRVDGGRNALVRRTPMTFRLPYGITWTLFPDWREPLVRFHDRHSTLIETGARAFADLVVDLLRATAMCREVSPLRDIYPRLSSLIEGTRSNPLQPGEPNS